MAKNEPRETHMLVVVGGIIKIMKQSFLPTTFILLGSCLFIAIWLYFYPKISNKMVEVGRADLCDINRKISFPHPLDLCKQRVYL